MVACPYHHPNLGSHLVQPIMLNEKSADKCMNPANLYNALFGPRDVTYPGGEHWRGLHEFAAKATGLACLRMGKGAS